MVQFRGMQVVSKTADIQHIIATKRTEGNTAGFVPTMGALHAGHLSLVQKARLENKIVVCSIFVNPTQFNDPSDFSGYPRQIEKDTQMLENAGCDYLFLPSETEIYPNNSYKQINFDPGFLDSVMEGPNRPGHFKGVAAVVKRLFDIIQPDKAYFGQKDYQQTLVIKKLVKDFKIPIEIIVCPTLREPNGLAMSSRNELLTQEQRNEAGLIYKLLDEAKRRIIAGITDFKAISEWAMGEYERNGNFKPEYFDICSAGNLGAPAISAEKWEKESLVICTAARIGKVRLIDNLIV